MDSIDNFAAALVARATADPQAAAAHEARRCLLNVLGTSIGASRTAEVDRLVAASAGGLAEAVPPGRSEAVDRYATALVTGFAAHLDDFDDTHLETVIHPGAATLGALFPLVLTRPVSAERQLRAFAIGVESQLRVGIAMSPSHYDLGWHITGTCGVLGAAVAAGIAMGFDPPRLAAAMGIAAQMTLGHRESFGTPVKAFHAGKAAANGLLAATLAESGVTVPGDAFEPHGGYFDVLADTFDDTVLGAEDIERRWVLRDNTYKPFPCGIVAHPAIEAAIALHGRVLAGTKEIASVSVRCNPLVVELMGRADASTGLEARFCARHGVAVGLLDGAGGLAQFSDARALDATVSSLRSRTRLEPDEACPREAATVTVNLGDGSTLEQVVTEAGGSSARPLSDEQLRDKFSALVEPVLPGRSGELADLAMALGAGSSLGDIDAAMRVVTAL